MRFRQESADTLIKRASNQANELKHVFILTQSFFKNFKRHAFNLEVLVNGILDDEVESQNRSPNKPEDNSNIGRRFTFQIQKDFPSSKKTNVNRKQTQPNNNIEEDDIVDLNNISQTEYFSSGSRNRANTDKKPNEPNFNGVFKLSQFSNDHPIGFEFDRNRFSFSPGFQSRQSPSRVKTNNLTEPNIKNSSVGQFISSNRNIIDQLLTKGENGVKNLNVLINQLVSEKGEQEPALNIKAKYDKLKEKYNDMKKNHRLLEKENVELKVQLLATKNSASEIVKMNEKMMNSHIGNNIDKSADASVVDNLRRKNVEQKITIKSLTSEKDSLSFILKGVAARVANLEQDIHQMREEYNELYKYMLDRFIHTDKKKSTNTLDLHEYNGFNTISIREHFSSEDTNYKELARKLDEIKDGCNNLAVDKRIEVNRTSSNLNNQNTKQIVLKYNDEKSANELGLPVILNNNEVLVLKDNNILDDDNSKTCGVLENDLPENQLIFMREYQAKNDIQINTYFNESKGDEAKHKPKRTLFNNGSNKKRTNYLAPDWKADDGNENKRQSFIKQKDVEIIKREEINYNKISHEFEENIVVTNTDQFDLFDMMNKKLHKDTRNKFEYGEERLTRSEVHKAKAGGVEGSRIGDNKYSFIEIDPSGWNSLDNDHRSISIDNFGPKNIKDNEQKVRGIFTGDMIASKDKYNNPIIREIRNSRRLMSDEKIKYPGNIDLDKFYSFRNVMS